MKPHFTDVPVFVDESEYARFCRPTVAAKAKDLTARPNLECIHGRRLSQKCYVCRAAGMVKEYE